MFHCQLASDYDSVASENQPLLNRLSQYLGSECLFIFIDQIGTEAVPLIVEDSTQFTEKGSLKGRDDVSFVSGTSMCVNEFYYMCNTVNCLKNLKCFSFKLISWASVLENILHTGNLGLILIRGL